MIKVSLIAKTNELPLNLISHAAKTCYTANVPEMGTTMDVENNLFKTGHHTTLQHNFFTFNISGLSVSSTIFGLHLTHPFYNTDQRSGRFSKMYVKPDFEEIQNYILSFWPDCDIESVMELIKRGREIYKGNIKKATEIAGNFIREERPNANDEYIEMNAGKIAQEQMRMFISTISPTALDYTINLSALTAIYRAAWSPELKYMTNQMKDLVLNEHPDLAYMFNEKTAREDNWAPKMNFNNIQIKTSPTCEVLEIDFNKTIQLDIASKDSVDLRYFTPENMDNSVSTIKTRVELSLATMGQDQRHRSIKRSTPELTGSFYLPPIPKELGLENIALEYMQQYAELAIRIDKNLALAIAPYGVMASYTKLSDLNGLIHEQEKRLCWSAQEEIYHASKQLHDYLMEHNHKDLAEKLTPACYKKACIEGRRYCGRDVSKLKTDKSIPPRKI